jgi:hydroxymethylpyrimidine/phosphomethylpyrimidine kinase
MKTDETFRYPRVLTIAGSDSGGGAGIQADLKTFSALGCYGMTAITAITAQNTCGVRAVSVVPAGMLREQVDAVIEDMGVDAVKIGMVPSVDHMEVIADAIDRYGVRSIVMDPVLASTSGTPLMDATATSTLARTLFHCVDLITPNLDEAGRLLGRDVVNRVDMERAAFDLLRLGARAVLLKGGHLSGDTVADLLVTSEGRVTWMQASRIATRNSHGTGCTLSSAIAAYLAQGETLENAVTQGREFVRKALAAGVTSQLGEGNGPLNHGFAPLPMIASGRKT